MEQIILKIVTLTLIVFGIIYFSKYKNKQKLLINNCFWLILSWSICIVLFLFSGIQYSIKLKIESFVYILIVLFLFCLGDYISKKYFFVEKKSKKIKNDFWINKINMLPLFIFSCICVICYIIYIFLNNNITLGVTRDINFSWISTSFLIGSSSSLIIWLYELAYANINDKKLSWYGIMSFIIFNLPVIVISGRDALVISLVATFIVFFYSRYYAKTILKKSCNNSKKLIKYGCIAIGIVMFYLIFLSSNRYGNEIDSALRMFEWSAKCTFPDYLKAIYYHLGGLGQFIINGIYYYSSQFSKFSLIFEEYSGPYLGGFYQLHYLSRLMPDSWGVNYQLVTEQVGIITSNAGIPGLKVFWETAIGYSIYDFGKWGTMLISFGGGLLVGAIYKWCENKKSILKMLFQAYICTAMFLTVELSPLFDYFYIFPLAWLIVFLIKEIFNERRRK